MKNSLGSKTSKIKQKSHITKKEWRDHTRKEKRDIYIVFGTIGLFILSWIASSFLSAIFMVLFAYFVYYVVAIFRHAEYRKKNAITAAVFFSLTGLAGSFVETPAETSQNANSAQNSSQIQLQEATKAAEQRKLREIEAAKPVVKTETKTEVIAFESQTRDDNTLSSGEKRIATVGVNGERTITYDVTYVKGSETGRTEVKNEVTKPSVAQVTLNGTYVKPAPAPAPKAQAPSTSSCPNGVYTNSAGNRVCSPYQSSGAPAGASAQCSDGTYSFSQSRRGTCSGHGGVASWL